MRFLDELEKVLKADERFIGEDNQVIKTKVSDAARGFRVIIMTTANSNDGNGLSSLILERQNANWCAI